MTVAEELTTRPPEAELTLALPGSAFWRQKAREALEDQARRQYAEVPRHLIMVGAQHPLRDSLVPGFEFGARLRYAAQQYQRLTAAGEDVEIFVPSSRHRDVEFGTTDLVSLADAGLRYLVDECGIPLTALHGEDWNRVFNSGDGVYSGADEMLVGTRGYKADDSFSRMHVVISPGQRTLSRIYAAANGINVSFMVPSVLEGRTDLFHNNDTLKKKITALGGFVLVNTVDPAGQNVIYKQARKERIPRDGNIFTVPTLEPQYADLPGHGDDTPLAA